MGDGGAVSGRRRTNPPGGVHPSPFVYARVRASHPMTIPAIGGKKTKEGARGRHKKKKDGWQGREKRAGKCCHLRWLLSAGREYAVTCSPKGGEGPSSSLPRLVVLGAGGTGRGRGVLVAGGDSTGAWGPRGGGRGRSRLPQAGPAVALLITARLRPKYHAWLMECLSSLTRNPFFPWGPPAGGQLGPAWRGRREIGRPL